MYQQRDINDLSHEERKDQLEDLIRFLWKSRELTPTFYEIETSHLLDFLLEEANKFIHVPNDSLITTISSITLLMRCYTHCQLDVCNKFFSSLDVAGLISAINKTGNLSLLKRFTHDIHLCIGKLSDINKDKIITQIINSLEPSKYVDYINSNIENIYKATMSESFSSDNSKTMLGTLKSFTSQLYGFYSWTNNKDLRALALDRVSSFYKGINYRKLGIIVNYRNRGIGPIANMINMFANLKIPVSMFGDFLCEIEFKKLAEDYNQRPIGAKQFSSFCWCFHKTKHKILKQWVDFFDTIDFSKVKEMNFAKSDIFFSIIYEVNGYKSIAGIRKIDFKWVGRRSREKYNSGFKRLLSNILSISSLSKNNYVDFSEGLGWEELRFIILNRKPGYEQLLTLLQEKCQYSHSFIEKSFSAFG